MIQANELRIGNWVMHPNGDVKISAEDIGSKYSLDACNPIPLTPEIFEKAGFEKETPDDKYGVVYKKDKFNFIIRRVNFGMIGKDDFGWSFELSDETNWATIVSKLQSLHQLQNLYFALTNTELNIQL
jgi:hypothetical protein